MDGPTLLVLTGLNLNKNLFNFEISYRYQKLRDFYVTKTQVNGVDISTSKHNPL